MIRFHNVSMRYPGGREALHQLTFHAAPGTFHFLIGHSGAGKSTVLKLIYRAEQPAEGTVVINGRNVERMNRAQLPALRRDIGVVFQDYKLLYDRSVFDNVALALEISRFDPSKIEGQTTRILDYVGLKERMYENPIALSGGEQQRVAIARAIVNRPALVIADEPTGNLDRDMARRILALFDALHRQGTTVLVATHDLSLARELGHPCFPLRDGRLLTPEELRENPLEETAC
ncbi:cell division ATP-binding protein FtsE [Magnetofaba australis]|uniref:Cell division ATP-binding protein FtsE n=1 Tax=Magnetofaba australis IT-1 TaxID=1434232 RepID=A0A1Y2JZH4_9PROT|nr:cell division ATP-binding protein FtsE [Magnetofaba australis]OSM00320.1 putative cell division ATP-binding protein FtsE [Magnetofaba australis IT-1]